MPNAFFFLEPSIVSQFFAISIMIELIFFMKIWRLGLLAAGLVLTTAGSGLFMLALSLPIFAFRYAKRLAPLVLIGLLVIIPAAAISGWDTMLLQRLDEFNRPGSSAYVRYMGPLTRMVESIQSDPLMAVRGNGAGSTVIDPQHNSLPLTKLVNEYGVLTTVLFFVFLLLSVFEGAPSAVLSWTVLVYFSVGSGGLSVPIYTTPLVLFGSLIRLRPRADEPATTAPHSISGGLVSGRAGYMVE
jgi:hypothetical protein